MRVAIFGSGPSGLLAAHAARRAGVGYSEITIFSEGEPSNLYGCQYLHAPIPDLSDADDYVNVSYELVGTPEMYWRKVYEGRRVTSVSPDELGGQHKAWDIRAVYAKLWEYWEGRIAYQYLHPAIVNSSEFSDAVDKWDITISTIPRNIWCLKNHDFAVTEIWAAGDAPELGIRTPFRVHEDNSVICNGFRDVGWYRMSRVFDHNTIEWPGRRRPPVENVAKVLKPTSTTCDCWEGRVGFFGRYGEWKKGVLAHQVFDDVERLMLDARLV